MASIGVSFQQTKTGFSVHVHRSQKAASSKLFKKRLPYNFKQMSKQIQQAKTSDAARPVVRKMRTKLSWLYKQLRNGEYGAGEIFAAILHAASMERIAKRKLRHLEEEEAAEDKNGSAVNAPGEEEEIYGKEEWQEAMQENEDIDEEMLKQMMEEMEELEEELAGEAMSEMQDMLSCANGELSEEEIKELKRKHRSDEERQLTKADLKYLKALFDRLEQEKREVTDYGLLQTEYFVVLRFIYKTVKPVQKTMPSPRETASSYFFVEMGMYLIYDRGVGLKLLSEHLKLPEETGVSFQVGFDQWFTAAGAFNLFQN